MSGDKEKKERLLTEEEPIAKRLAESVHEIIESKQSSKFRWWQRVASDGDNEEGFWLLNIIDSVSVAMTGMMLIGASLVILGYLIKGLAWALAYAPEGTGLGDVLRHIWLDFCGPGWGGGRWWPAAVLLFFVLWAIFRWDKGWKVIKRSNPD